MQLKKLNNPTWKSSFFHVYNGIQKLSMSIYKPRMLNNENLKNPPPLSEK